VYISVRELPSAEFRADGTPVVNLPHRESTIVYSRLPVIFAAWFIISPCQIPRVSKVVFTRTIFCPHMASSYQGRCMKRNLSLDRHSRICRSVSTQKMSLYSPGPKLHVQSGI
jgi:hypothetical protein